MERNRKTKQFIQIIILLLLCPGALEAQVDDFINTRKISLSRGDTTVVAGILADVKIEKVDQDVFYFWYANGTIYSNQGGYAGNLLHGDYVEYGVNGCLILKGQYEQGLRAGQWTRWYEDGRLLEKTDYQSGRLEGKHVHYAHDGRIAHSARYHEGILDGKMLTVERDTLFEISYKNGLEKKREALHVFEWTQE